MLDEETVERDFAALLASGWPKIEPRPRPTLGGLSLLLVTHGMRMAEQLANSSVPETREFWRARLALHEARAGERDDG